MSSAPLGTFGQACRQCQKCYKQESSDLHLLLCSQCHLNHYCSTACQISDWPDHKLQCNLNRDNHARMKESEEQEREQQTSTAHSAREVDHRLRKWLQVHRPLIHLTLIHALSLQRTPDMCMSHVLSIFVTPNFTSTSSNSAKDIARSFLVQRTSIRPFNEAIEYLGDIGPQYENVLSTTFERSITMRSEGGVGIAVVMISVPEVHVTRIATFGNPSMLFEDELPLNEDWENRLKEVVAKGIFF